MKKITLFFILCLTMANWSYSQCTTTTGGEWPTGGFVVGNTGGVETISANNWPNAEFSLLTGIVPGNVYTVAASSAGSTYITVTNTADDSVIVHGADSVSFTAAAGVTALTIYWHLDSFCGTAANVDTLTTIQCTSCTCAEIAPPGAATTPTPADTATDISIAGGLVTPFSWVDATSGGGIEGYNLSLGTDTAGTNIGTLTDFPNGNGITYGSWANNTTYYWSVTAVNCFGTTQSTVWSFTTANCLETAAPDAVNTPGPADTATGVVLNENAGNPSLNFTWVDPGTGAVAESYTINIGTVDPPDNTFTGFGNGDPISGLAINTTYFWSVDAVNCFGTTPGPVWSFTTGNTLSVEENDVKLFNVFPNPIKDIVTIDTNLSVDNVIIVNGLGQTVLQVRGDRMIDNTINLSNLKSGLYFMNINAGDKVESIKIIKE